jgi:Glycosyl hydrolase family 95 catalytic domain
MGKVSRRGFLGTMVAAAAARGLFTRGAMAEAITPPGESNPPILPWNREIPLRESAGSAVIEGLLNPSDPYAHLPGSFFQRGGAMAITNPDIKSSVWGPPNRITLSMLKTDVYDRRVKWPPLVTLKDIREGAFSPVNKDAIPSHHDTTRPVDGYLLPGGGRSDPYYECWTAYPFPCMKPVGQIILMLDGLEDAPLPKLQQSCANGLVRFELEKAGIHANVEIVLSMTRNLYAIRTSCTGLTSPAGLRLYRHQDQGHLTYMTPDGKFRRHTFSFTQLAPQGDVQVPGPEPVFDYEADKDWNGPIEPPVSGREGNYFWIRQRMPAEKTFPQGFEYVMMASIADPASADIQVVNGKTGLGTPPPDQSIRDAPGSAATATFMPLNNQTMTAYVVIVSQIDAPDFMAEAKHRLDAAKADGFDQVVDENTRWYNDLYDRRESGRVFYGDAGSEATEDIKGVYSSWYNIHGGGCRTDMRRLQASAPYSRLESDSQPWHGLPCYNEWFYTPVYARNRSDSCDMWKQIIEHWWQASRGNAREMFGMPGMALMHGYLPPIKADKYVHTEVTLELCVDSFGQIMKSVWDEWDYGGSRDYLASVYPMLRDMALFYAAYAKKGDDGYYHVIPAMAEECWGIYPGFSHSIDSTGALCMFRWALLAVADAAELLGKDENLRSQWRQIAARMAPYPTWKKPEGEIFARVRGVEPFYYRGDHEFYEGVFPTTLAGDLNLDSSAEEKATMLRTVRVIQEGSTAEALVLLGACPDTVASALPNNGRPIEDWKGLRTEVDRYPERLVNSRSGRIHLFPCVPPSAVVAFRRFQARGGILVSAARDGRGVYLVEIEPRRDVQCAVMNPWPGKLVAIRDQRTSEPVDFKMDKTNGECLLFAVEAQHCYRMERA